MHSYAALTVKHFDSIRAYLYEVAGISLADGKRQMVENRIAKRLSELQMPSFASYVAYLHSHDGQEELVHLVNSLTTNVTHFLGNIIILIIWVRRFQSFYRPILKG